MVGCLPVIKDCRPETAMTDTARPVPSQKPLTPAAERALAEAEARRKAAAEAASSPKEVGGRGGLEPARYGDWEVKGIAADF